MPKATDYIQEQIDLVKKLEELGYTYEIPRDYDTRNLQLRITGGTCESRVRALTI